jgi:hypothetical protein
LIPSWPDGPRVVLWTRGDLKSYTDYRLEMVMVTQSRQ